MGWKEVIAIKFEDEYMDILQNIDFAIVQVYREHSEMHDWDVMEALEAAIRGYQAELSGRPARVVRPTPTQKDVRDAVKAICDWRLGRVTLETPEGEEVDLDMKTLTVEEVIACLQRVLKSVKYWNKEGGQRGYFDFVSQFLP